MERVPYLRGKEESCERIVLREMTLRSRSIKWWLILPLVFLSFEILLLFAVARLVFFPAVEVHEPAYSDWSRQIEVGVDALNAIPPRPGLMTGGHATISPCGFSDLELFGPDAGATWKVKVEKSPDLEENATLVHDSMTAALEYLVTSLVAQGWEREKSPEDASAALTRATPDGVVSVWFQSVGYHIDAVLGAEVGPGRLCSRKWMP